MPAMNKKPSSKKVAPTPQTEIEEVTPMTEQTTEIVATKEPKKKKETEERLNAEEIAARKKQHELKIGLTGNKIYSKSELAESTKFLDNQLLPEFGGIRCGMLPWTVENCLEFLKLTANPDVQRDIDWGHVWFDLTIPIRSALNTQNDEVLIWEQGTNTIVISKSDIGIDGRHRMLAFVLAVGTPEQVDELLRIVNRHELQGYDDDGVYSVAPDDLLKPNIPGFTYADPNSITAPDNWGMCVQIGANDAAFMVLDGAIKKRTPADALKYEVVSRRWLAETGTRHIADDVCTALRYIYLRSNWNFVKDKDGKDIKKLGSLRAPGKTEAVRYPVYSRIFFGTDSHELYLAKAIRLLDSALAKGKKWGEKYSVTYDESNIDVLKKYNVWTVLVLALQAGYNEETLKLWINSLCMKPTALDENGAIVIDNEQRAVLQSDDEQLKNPAYWLRKYCSESTNSRGIPKRGAFLVGGVGNSYHQPLAGYALLTGLISSLVEAEENEYSLMGETDKSGKLIIEGFLAHCQHDEQTVRIESGNPDSPAWDEGGFSKSLVQEAEKAVLGKASQGRAKDGTSTRKRRGPKA